MRLPGPNLNLDRTSVRFNRFRFRTSVQNRTSASLVTDFCQQTSRTNDARTLDRFLQGIEYKHSNHSIPLPSPLILTTYNHSQRSKSNTTQPHHFRTSPTIFGNPLPFLQQTAHSQLPAHVSNKH